MERRRLRWWLGQTELARLRYRRKRIAWRRCLLTADGLMMLLSTAGDWPLGVPVWLPAAQMVPMQWPVRDVTSAERDV